MARGFGSTFGAGSTDKISSSYSTTASAQISQCAWFWVNGAGGASSGMLMDFMGSALAATGLEMNGGAGSMKFTVPFATTTGVFTWTAPSTGAWHHIVLTYDGSSTANKPTVYIDGSSVSVTVSTTPAGSLNVGGSGLIGNSNSGGHNWDGKIAETGYWNGSLLAASEAAALARGIAPLFVRRAALSLYLPLLGVSSGEPDWGPAHATQTITGTANQSHAPTSFWMPTSPFIAAPPVLPWRRPNLTYRRRA